MGETIIWEPVSAAGLIDFPTGSVDFYAGLIAAGSNLRYCFDISKSLSAAGSVQTSAGSVTFYAGSFATGSSLEFCTLFSVKRQI